MKFPNVRQLLPVVFISFYLLSGYINAQDATLLFSGADAEPYTEDVYIFTDLTGDPDVSGFDDYDLGSGEAVTVTRSGGGTFGLNAIDINVDNGTGVRFQAFLSSAQQGADFDVTAAGPQTGVMLPSDFDNVDEIRITNLGGGFSVFLDNADFDAAAACSAPTAQATAATFGTETASTLELTSWTAPAGGADGYAVFINSSNTFTAPTDGDEPTADLTWNNAGQQPIYFGNSAAPTITVTGLDANTTYFFQIYSYSDCSGTETYETTGLAASDLTAAPANNVPTSADFTLATGVDGTIIFTNADFPYTDLDSDPRVSIEIITLPGAGTLYVDANANDAYDALEEVSATDVITEATITAGDLQYEAASTAGNSIFTFTVNDGTDDSTPDNTATLWSVDNALDFDGVDDFVETAHDDAFTPSTSQAITFEAWVNPSDNTQGYLGSIYENILSAQSNFFVGLNSGQIQVSGDGTDTFFGTSTVSTFAWSHVAVVIETSGNVTIYINGIEDASGNVTLNTSSSTTSTFRIGNLNNPTNYFTGEIDEVRIWNDVRTPSEIRASAASRLTGGETGLVLYYNFNAGIPSGDNTGLVTATDLSAGGNDGTLNNFDVDGTNGGGSGISNWVASGALISTAATTPNLVVTQSNVVYPSNGTAYDYGTINVGNNSDITFNLENQGFADLTLGAAPSFGTGTDYNFPSGTYSASTVVNPGATQTLEIQFAPTAGGTLTDQVTIASDDPATPYLLNLTGVGNAAPSIVAGHFFDTDGDGDIDELVIELSEEVDEATADAGDFAASTGISVDAVSTVASTNVDNTLDATDADEYVTFEVSGVGSTAVTGITLDFTADAANGDLSGVPSGLVAADDTDITKVDQAAPVVLSAITQDDGNGFIDQILVTMSEVIDAGTLDEVAVAGITDDFSVAGYQISGVLTVAGTGADDDEIVISITEGGVINPDTDSTPQVDLGAGDLNDLASPANGNIVYSAAATDAAGPAIVSAVTDDTDGNGEIDEILVTFSEVIDASTLDETANPIVTDDFAIVGYDILSVTPVSGTGVNDDEVIIVIDESGTPDTGATPQVDLTVGTISDSVEPTLNPVYSADATDGAAPLIVSFTLDASNGYVDVTFSEVVNTAGGGPVVVSDFDITNFSNGSDGSLLSTDITITDVVKNDGADTPLDGTESVIRVNLGLTGNPDGVDDTIELQPDQDNVDRIGDVAASQNFVDQAETTGTILLNATTSTLFVSATAAADNTYIDIVFNTPVNRGGGNPLRFDNDGNGDAGREIQSQITTSIRNAVLATTSPYDALFAGFGAAGSSTYDDDGSGATVNLSGNTGDIGLSDQGSSLTWRLPMTVTGTPTGEESFYLFPSGGDEVRPTTGGFQNMSALEYIQVFLADETQNDFSNATITYYDVDEDGNIDEVLVETDDDVDDASVNAALANGDFTIGGVLPQTAAIMAAPANTDDPQVANDNSFTIEFFIEGTYTADLFEFTTGILEDDAGNLFTDGGDIAMDDNAFPQVINGITRDIVVDGILDAIDLEVSEDVAGPGVAGGYDVDGGSQTVGTPSLVNSYTIRVPFSGVPTFNTTETPSIDVYAAAFADNAGNLFAGISGSPDDGAAPFAQIADDGTNTTYVSYPRTYGSLSITIDGRVDDPDALVFVELDGNGNLATVDAGGNWTVNTSVSDQGTYDVSVTTFDSNGNIGNDTTTDEIAIAGGVTVTPADAPTFVCEDSDYVTLNDLIITETDPANFAVQTNRTILLSLPDDFFFDTDVAPGVSVTGSEVGITTQYIGTAILRINVNVSGIVETNIVTISGLSVTSEGDGVGTPVDMTRFGGDAIVFGASTNGQVFGTMEDAPTPADLTSIDVTAGTPTADITEYASRVGEPITLDADDALNTVNWYDYDGNLVFQGATPTESGLATQLDAFTPTGYFDHNTPGLYTFYVEDDNGNCQSNQLKINILIYDDDDFDSPGSPSFITRTYNVTDAADNIYISNPAGHDVGMFIDGGVGLDIVSAGDPFQAQFDPGIAGIQGSPGHLVTYEIRNLTSGEIFELVRELTVQAAATLFDNGPLDYYCDDDAPVTFSMDGSQFNAVYPNLPYVQYVDGVGLRHNGGVYDIDGQDLHDGTNVNGTTPGGVVSVTPYEFSFDPSFFTVPAGDFEHVYFYSVIVDADGVKRVGAEDYFIVYGEADLDLSNVSNGQSFCSNESSFTIQRNLQYVNTMDFSDPTNPVPTYFTQSNQNITTGYQLYYSPDGVAPYTLMENFTGGNLSNDFDPNDPDQDGTTYRDDPTGEANNIGFYRLDYTTGAVGPNSCETTISKFVEVQLQPDMLELNPDPINLFGGVLSIQNTDEYLIEMCQFNSMPNIQLEGSAYSIGFTGFNSTSPIAQNNYVLITRGDPRDPNQDGVQEGVFSTIATGYAEQSNAFFSVSAQTGVFTTNETLTGQTSGAIAYVENDPLTGTVEMRYRNGSQFLIGEQIVGQSSLQSATLDAVNFNSTLSFISLGDGVQVGDYINIYHDGVYRYGTITSAPTASPADVTWYNASQIAVADDISIIPSSSLGINTNSLGTLLAEQLGLEFYFSTTAANGCESELRKVTVNVYGLADAPELDLSSTVFDEEDVRSGTETFYEYELDYCTATPGGNAVADDLDLPSLNAGEEYLIYRYFNSDVEANPNNYGYLGQVTITNNGDLPYDVSGDLMLGNQSFQYTVYLRDNINGTSGFNGCQSRRSEIRTYGHDTPTAPDALDFTAGTTDFHVAEGDVLDPIFHANVGMDEYYWYEEDNRADQIGDELNSGEAMSVNTLKGIVTPGKQLLVNASNEALDANDDAVNDQYTYYVSRLDNIVAANNFDGCESLTNTPVTITVHPKQAAPSIVSDNASGTSGQPAQFPDINKDGDGGNDDASVDYYYAVCLDQVEGTLVFTSSQGLFGYYTNLSGGPFTVGEMITADGGATAYITTDNAGELMLRDVTGSFAPTEEITGTSSGATADLTATHTYGGASSRYEWYAHNGTNRTSADPLFTGASPTFDDLRIGSIAAAANRYFEVVQVTDDDVFAGTEGEPVLMRIEFFDQDDLTFTSIGDGDDICHDDLGDGAGTIQMALESDGIAATASLLTYSVVSSPTDFSDAIILDDDGADGDGFGNPLIDIAGWHAAAGGSTVGGVATTHTITMTYIQANGGCEITNSATITIHPDPDISFTVGGEDINDLNFATLYDEFCYEDGLVGLQGTLSDGTPLTSGSFTSSETGAITTNNGFAQLNPLSEHNAFHGVAGTAGEFLNQSTITVTYSYTDEFGCQRSVNVPIYVNPEPEVYDVERDGALPSSDLAADRTSNRIRLTDFCADATTSTAEIRFVDPLDADPGSNEEDDYSAYTFEWTINGQPTPDVDLNGLPDPQVGTNSISFTPAATNVNISVVVTDVNGCEETFTETHTLQELPTLEIVGIVDRQPFCTSFGGAINPTVSDATQDGDNATNTVDQADLSWSVDSYITDELTTTQVDFGTGALPTIDQAQLLAWHDAISQVETGIDEADGVGGSTSYHRITVTYTDDSREYQGTQTLCENTRTETIVVNPLPEIDFTVAGFADAYTGETASVPADGGYVDHFCYDYGTVNLIGITRNTDGTVGTLPAGTGVFSTTGGVTNTGNSLASWSPVTANGSDPHALNAAGIDITFTFTDASGCQSMVTKTLYVDPQPDPIEIAGDEITFDQICADGNIVARVPLFDPASGTEVGTGASALTYATDFDFSWNIPTATSIVDQTDNTITFTSSIGNDAASKDFVASVTITNLNTMCTWDILNESHEIQELPEITYTQITDLSEGDIAANILDDADIYCWEDGDITLSLSTNTGTISGGDLANLGYTIDSYTMVSGAVSMSPSVATPTTGNPTLDFSALHEAQGGLEIGGDTTVHLITMYYDDLSNNTYQGQLTNCSAINQTAVIVYPRPDITFAYAAGLDGIADDDPDLLEVCYDDASFGLQGLLSDLSEINGGGSGSFTVYMDTDPGPGVTLVETGGVGNTNSSNLAQFDPSDAHDAFHGTGAGGGRYLATSTNVVEFSYTDDIGCSHSVTKTIIVHPSPEIEGGTGDQIVYDAICLGFPIEAHVVVIDPDTGVEVADYTRGTGYIFEWITPEETVTVNGDPNVVFNTSNLSVSVTLNVTTPEGCVTTITDTDPQGFPPTPRFTYMGITENSPLGLDVNFFQDNPQLNELDVQYGVNYMRFTLKPEGEVFDANLHYEIVRQVDGVPMSFASINITTMGMGVNETTLTAGRYEAELVMQTYDGCDISSGVRIITILPTFDLGDPYTGAGYSENFTEDLGGWYIEVASEDGKTDNRNSSWRRVDGDDETTDELTGVHNDHLDYNSLNLNPGPSEDYDDGGMIMTNASDGSTSYYSAETSFVYSPAFNYQEYDNPFLSFDYIYDFDSNRDGVVVQVSDDDGRTWTTLGDNDINSGINWYTHQGISSGPGDNVGRSPETGTNPDLVGFADAPRDEAENPVPEWILSKHQLTEGDYRNQYIRYRFALGAISGNKSTAANIADGFAFDNFTIDEVTKIVLVEQFSSTLSQESKDYEALVHDGGVDIHDINWDDGTQGLMINYFTDMENQGTTVDLVNARNKVDPATRATYYGVSGVPETRVAGQVVPYDIDDTPEDFGNGFNAISLSDVDFQIFKDHPTEPDGIVINPSDADVLSVSVTYTATVEDGGVPSSYPEVEIGFFFAVVEKVKTVTSSVYNAEEIHYPLRVLLPGPEGAYYRGPLADGDEFTYDMNWTISGIDNPDNLRVIAFAQYYSHPDPTKIGGIEQANFVDFDGLGKTNSVVGLEDLLTNDVLELYPNPADDRVTMKLAEAPMKPVLWKISDQSGKQVLTGRIERGIKEVTIDTDELPSGMYIIQIFNDKNSWIPKKVIISH